MARPILVAVLAVVAALVATGAVAQPAGERPAGARADDASADAFGEMLRRTDPAAHARYVSLRRARDASLEELRQAQDRYRHAGPELRLLSAPQLRAARRKYAADTVAFLDFLDERDRLALEQYRAEIARIEELVAERARAREELKELTQD
jgi:hypothetical protein